MLSVVVMPLTYETVATNGLITFAIMCIFQFEGGLFATASVVESAYSLAGKVGKAPTISQVSAAEMTCRS